MADFVTFEDVREYVKDEGNESWTDEDLEYTLNSEYSQQQAKCRAGFFTDTTTYTEDLRQALLRRCQRALALRPIALNAQVGPEGDVRVIPRTFDPEINRLEAPYRSLPVG